MTALFFIFLTLFFIVVQTILLPGFSWFDQCFDLLIIPVLFLSLHFSHAAMILAVILIGCIMDSISGVPFYYHVFSYIWIYLIVQLVKQLVFQRSVVFILIISIAAVLIQQGFLLFSIFVNEGVNQVLAFDYRLIIRQIFWGVVFIPAGIWLINVFRQYLRFVAKTMTKQIAQNRRG